MFWFSKEKIFLCQERVCCILFHSAFELKTNENRPEVLKTTFKQAFAVVWLPPNCDVKMQRPKNSIEMSLYFVDDIWWYMLLMKILIAKSRPYSWGGGEGWYYTKNVSFFLFYRFIQRITAGPFLLPPHLWSSIVHAINGQISSRLTQLEKMKKAPRKW